MKGTEKVVLIQEQLAKNRLIIDEAAGDIKATIQSSTHERKTVTTVVTKKEMLYIKISAFTEDINAAVVLRFVANDGHTDPPFLTHLPCCCCSTNDCFLIPE